MKDLGIRDVVGPIMVGPSSSHTAGALRIASMARDLLDGAPVDVTFTLYGSFSQTYRGHGTDHALVAGMLGIHTDDLRIRDSFRLADEAGLRFAFKVDPTTKVRHPNTVDIHVVDDTGSVLDVRGESIGGGAARLSRLDDLDIDITGEYNSVIVYQRDVPGVLGFIASTFGRAGINIGSVSLKRRRKGGQAINMLEVDDPVPDDVRAELLAYPDIEFIRFVPANGLNRVPQTESPRLAPEEAEKLLPTYTFEEGSELLAFCEERKLSVGAAFIEREQVRDAVLGVCEDEARRYLSRALHVMRESAQTPLGTEVKTMGGLIGGEAKRLQGAVPQTFAGVFTKAAQYAMAVLETNASMGRIVAAPTAGASGVLPGVLLALQEEQGFTDDELVDALACAAAIGYFFSRNATVAGAEGGCQAEMGTASAMAAGAAAQLFGASPQTCFDAAAIAITNMLGLVCDPVRGLVEEPCQKRNASAAANALISCELALSGVAATAPFDETVDATRRVGQALPMELRETALGGIATCPSCVGDCAACR